MLLSEFTAKMNEWGQQQVPFLFVVDFEMRKPVLIRLDEVNREKIRFEINGFTNARGETIPWEKGGDVVEIQPIPFSTYNEKFQKVFAHLSYGDSYLTNLTTSTRIKLTSSLYDLYLKSKARYKLFFNDEFLVFSPEIFVQIRDGKIFSYPMKGTIDASLPDAHRTILEDRKELAEHVTIVDLIRNDLSQVATDVMVKRFRYIDELKTNHKNLLQVSSEITGVLPSGYECQLGSILIKLLPAGSVSGAPKPKTLEIIRQAEGAERGYYTGVFGYFDGKNLDSGVMIRYIQRLGDTYYYHSGAGITTQSVAEAEYQETIDKIYVPVT